MTLSERLQVKREEVLPFCAKYGARNVRAFGSVARGEADAESDIDLLVEFDRCAPCWTTPGPGWNGRDSSAARWM
jgi:predicted nucleotidyltransferase